jgi:hypothetical protein
MTLNSKQIRLLIISLLIKKASLALRKDYTFAQNGYDLGRV